MSEVNERLAGTEGILFDLDNTLYPSSKGVFDRVSRRIDEYVGLRTGLSPASVKALRADFIERYGTTLGGLVRHHGTAPEEYLEYVHDIPVEKMLERDDTLRRFLDRIGLPMVIFTNASAFHARRVLEILGVTDCFVSICDLAETDYLGKPHQEAFHRAAQMLGCSASKILFADDMPVNIHAAARVGMVPVHINADGDGTGHLSVESITDLADHFQGMPWFG